MLTLVLVVTAYLIGSIPFGLLIGFRHGIDIREHGSRNIGATNAGRVLGRRWGHACLALDILKGAAPTLAAGTLLVERPISAEALLGWLAVGLAAVLGHVFPVYLRFQGGKGVATTIGVALGLYPFFTFPMIVALVGYAVGRFATGMVSVGSLALAIVFPVAVWGLLQAREESLEQVWPLLAVAVLLGLLIVARHRSNIVRLLRGEEARVGAERSEARGS